MVHGFWMVSLLVCSLAEGIDLEELELNREENPLPGELPPLHGNLGIRQSSTGQPRSISPRGDRILIDVIGGSELRVAVNDRSRIWADAVVPYEISLEYSEEDVNTILLAMQDFRDRTCVQFVPRANEQPYIVIRPGNGCMAGVGRPQEVNRVSLDDTCLDKGVVLHELMHTLGFFHEQNRPDRDQYVRINYDNIIPGTEQNFEKLPADLVQLLGVGYDYGSVLHYGPFDFALDESRPTIEPLQEGAEIGQRDGFSGMDVARINRLYNCALRG